MTTDEAKDEMMAMMRARRFQTFQSSINAISSQPPDFDEVVQLFGLTIETAKIIVVTSYTTAAARFLRHWMVDKKTNKRYPVARLARTECEEEGVDREAYITTSAIAAELDEERDGEKSFELRVMPRLFGTSIWDKTHLPKNVKIMQLFTATSTATVKPSKTEDGTLPIEHYDQIRQVRADCGGSYLKADDKTHAELVTALDHKVHTKLMGDHDKDGAIDRMVSSIQSQATSHRSTALSSNCTRALSRWRSTFEVAHKAQFGEAEVTIVAATPHAKGIPPLGAHALPTPVEDPETEAREKIDKRRRLKVASKISAFEMFYRKNVPANAKDSQHCASATAQFITILTLNCTYDQYILPTYAKAMIA
ncbi:hypothetical protein LTR33_002509 [Friedmanniomyces endolithicus]|nr:hypothetical protein LTR33_002509 [Friedmanniomyces endolithicus]